MKIRSIMDKELTVIDSSALANKLVTKLAKESALEIGRELVRNNQAKKHLRLIRRAGKVIKLIKEVE
ncbi:MAG: hypothetical protein BWY21_00310 [Parcubacteria group bacterium ADurb.Bin216]|nr:MAG: hypothetical protein BWY21_00310 [Parcubacteria group bacterium ADurb.Bin216]